MQNTTGFGYIGVILGLGFRVLGLGFKGPRTQIIGF